MVISLVDFTNLSDKEKKKNLQDLKSEIGISGITQAWGISRSKLYNMLHEYNIPVKPRKSGNTNKQSQDEGSDHESNRTVNNQETAMEKVATASEAYNAWENSGLDFDLGASNSNEFSLQLDTQGPAVLVGDAIQMLLKSDPWANSKFLLHVTLKQI